MSDHHYHTRNGRSKTYIAWIDMKQRCYNENYPYYHLYGGRGIEVCDKWLESFLYFLDDMGDASTKDSSLDRSDTNGDYTKENCRWATHKEQQNNRRDNIKLTFNDQTKTLREWSKEIGIPKTTLEKRFYRGWSTEKILTQSKRANYLYTIPKRG